MTSRKLSNYRCHHFPTSELLSRHHIKAIHQIRTVVQLLTIHLSWRYLPIVFIFRFLDHHRLLLGALYLQQFDMCRSIFIQGLYLCCSVFLFTLRWFRKSRWSFKPRFYCFIILMALIALLVMRNLKPLILCYVDFISGLSAILSVVKITSRSSLTLTSRMLDICSLINILWL